MELARRVCCRHAPVVLQDLGFNLDEAEAPLGLIVASKERTALNPATARIRQLLDIFLDIEIEIDEEQAHTCLARK